MSNGSVLEIIAQGAWNGGTPVDNTIFENAGMAFKGDIPVNSETIEERIGVRTRIAAPSDVRIGQLALQDLLDQSKFDPSRIKLLIGATNVGDDKFEHGPQVKHPYEQIRGIGNKPDAFDLYAGCPGFNVSVELVFMLSLSGILQPGDISIIIGAENIHRADAFKAGDTAAIIFGDDAMATALETTAGGSPDGSYTFTERARVAFRDDFIDDIARKILELNDSERLDGLIIDNQLGKILYRVPATAARIQHRLTELMHPESTREGDFTNFGKAIKIYDQHVNSFAFDIMTMSPESMLVEEIAKAYVTSGKYRTVASVHIDPAAGARIVIHRGEGYSFVRPSSGVIDTITRTHGCFAEFIEAVPEEDNVFGTMNGKGVFLYATRSAPKQFEELLSANNLTVEDIDLLIEHQANFAMIPMTLEKVFAGQSGDTKEMVRSMVADKMVTNIHLRGNCSVVCMQRLPYDLNRGALKEDNIQGWPINRNVDNLKNASLIMYDSVGAGMTRSSFIFRK